MLSSNEIKTISSLKEKKYRDQSGLFVVEGEKMVSEAMQSGFEVVRTVKREDVGDAVMKRISSLTTPPPVLAVVRKPEDLYAGDSPALPEKGLYLALDSIRDPGNLGTILRISDWFGISAVFASHDTVDVFSPKVVQATMGAVFRVRFRYADLHAVADAFHAAGGSVYGTFLDGDDIYAGKLHTGTDSPVIVVTGNESEGISPEIDRLCDGRLLIPSFSRAGAGSESLNAAVATAVTLSEFRRRSL